MAMPNAEPQKDRQAENYYQYLSRSRKQKAALVFVSIIFVTVFTFGILRINNLLHIPLPESWTTVATTTQTNAPVEGLSEDPEVLRARDTDSDGLNDFEEIYVYKTSAYLADSYSDTSSDKDEILAGEDPNCPRGIVCFSANSLSSSDSQTTKN